MDWYSVSDIYSAADNPFKKPKKIAPIVKEFKEITKDEYITPFRPERLKSFSSYEFDRKYKPM